MARPSNAGGAQKLVRILRLVNDLAPRDLGLVGDPVPIGEFAAMAGMGVDEAVSCIRKINEGCGDALPEMLVMFDEETGSVTPFRIEGAFSRPLRLTPAEARGLVLALEEAGYAEEQVVEKIRGAFPAIGAERFLDIRRTAEASPSHAVLALMTAAARTREVVEIEYRGPGGGQPSRRSVEPARIVYDEGQGTWYVVAWCRSSEAWRTFRIDRVASADATGERFSPRDRDGEEAFSFSRSRVAVLAVHDPSAVWDAYDWRGLEKVASPDPFDRGRLADEEVARGAYIAEIPWIEGSYWLPQMLLRTMGGVEALRPVALRAAVRELALTTLGRLA